MNSDQNQIGVDLMRHVDRISTLPDDIITSKILSLLPTRDSVRTSVLSTRWKHLYAFVPVIDFEDLPSLTSAQFTAVVSEVLNTVTNNLPYISKFRIHSEVMFGFINFVLWIETAVSHSVQKLDVVVVRPEGSGTPPCFLTPHAIFTCESLVSLSLNYNFVLDVPDIVCLPRLKEMYLHNVILWDEESVTRLLSSCPVLENLVVNAKCLSDKRVVNVSVPSLKELNLNLMTTEVELVINCPNLERLGCNIYAVSGYSGDVLESLKVCYLDIECSGEEGKLMEVVKRIYKVESLTLSGESMQALLIPSCSLPIFENLIILELESSDSNGWQLLPIILERSPRLKDLGFLQGFYNMDYYYGNPFPLPEHVPVCVSSHLKEIRIDKFFGDEDEYRWVEYFLKNALVLEKMEICPWLAVGLEDEGESEVEEEGQEEGEGEFDMERLSMINKTLSTFQHFSQASQFVLEIHPHVHNVLEI